MLTLDQLRTLQAIEDEGSFANAGKRLHRTTSAVSYAIATLEKSLGVTLFDRSGHRAELTPAGRLVLSDGRELLRRADQLDHRVQQLVSGWEARLSITIDGALDFLPLMRTITEFTKLAAPTNIQIQVEHLERVEQRFRTDQGDLLMGFLPKSSDLHSIQLPPLTLWLVAHASHPVHAQRQTTDRMRRYIELLVSDSEHRTLHHHAIDIEAAHRIRVPDFRAKREALRAGVGFGWLPEHLANDLIETGELSVIDLPGRNKHTFDPVIAHPHDVHLGRAARFFVDRLRSDAN